MNNLFNSVFDNGVTIPSITPQKFLFCIVSAIGIGAVIALFYSLKTRSTGSFRATLVLIPAAVCMVIMMVNGNVGAGVAVAGAFSLVRFRSAPGSAREIAAIFIATGSGLACGMGYIGYALLFGLVLSLANTVIAFIPSASQKGRTLKITVPEDLNFTDAFDDLFEKYTSAHSLTHVKTTNMGSLFKLIYDIQMKDPKAEKEFIDELRCRNANLEICISQREESANEL